MLKFLKRFRRPPPQQQARIVIEPGGFVVAAGDGRETHIRWVSVVRVLTYKRDNFTTDEIVVVFLQREDQAQPIEVSEEWPGFSDLFEPLERELGVSAEWYLKTSAKPFEADFQVIFERNAEQPRDAIAAPASGAD